MLDACFWMQGNRPERSGLECMPGVDQPTNQAAFCLETLYETGSLKDEVLYKSLHQRLQTLGKKINRFIQSVEKEHRTDA